jgi:hypothetical protein
MVASYREAFGYHREDNAIGPAPGRANVEARAAWQAAYTALDAPEDERQIAARDDAELRNLIHDYEREQAWAPAFVDDELREANLAARDYRAQLVFEQAGLDAAADRRGEKHAEAAQRIADLEALNEHLDKRAADLDEIAQARSAWYAETAESRELADRARAELRRRGAEPDVHEHVHEGTDEVDRTEHQKSDPVLQDELRPVPDRHAQEAASRDRDEPVEVRLAVIDDQAREEPAEVDRTEPAPARKEPAREELTESRVQAELRRAREATDILAERQAERHRAEIEASDERDREYARRRDDELDHEVDLHHELPNDHSADISRGSYDG